MMRSTIAVGIASIAFACLGGIPALAQDVDSGREFQVNPVSPSGNILLYPGGQYTRTLPALRQPGDNGAPIRLHMPAKGVRKPTLLQAVTTPPSKPKVAARAAPVHTARARIASAPAASAPVVSAPSGAAQSAAGAAAIFGGAPSNLFTGPITPPPVAAKPKTRVATAEPKAPLANAEPKAQLATAETNAGIEGLTNRRIILFAADAEEPAESARDAIRFLAGDLTNAMIRPQSRVWLMGHGGAKGDKGSEARRISLKRALAIRQLLMDAGLSMDRISVQAQGGVDDSGPADRVDVYVKE